MKAATSPGFEVITENSALEGETPSVISSKILAGFDYPVSETVSVGLRVIPPILSIGATRRGEG